MGWRHWPCSPWSLLYLLSLVCWSGVTSLTLLTLESTLLTESGVLKWGDVIDPAHLGVYFTYWVWCAEVGWRHWPCSPWSLLYLLSLVCWSGVTSLTLLTLESTLLTESGVLKWGDVIDPAYLGVYLLTESGVLKWGDVIDPAHLGVYFTYRVVVCWSGVTSLTLLTLESTLLTESGVLKWGDIIDPAHLGVYFTYWVWCAEVGWRHWPCSPWSLLYLLSLVCWSEVTSLTLLTLESTLLTESGVLKWGDIIDPAHLGVYFTYRVWCAEVGWHHWPCSPWSLLYLLSLVCWSGVTSLTLLMWVFTYCVYCWNMVRIWR